MNSVKWRFIQSLSCSGPLCTRSAAALSANNFNGHSSFFRHTCFSGKEATHADKSFLRPGSGVSYSALRYLCKSPKYLIKNDASVEQDTAPIKVEEENADHLNSSETQELVKYSSAEESLLGVHEVMSEVSEEDVEVEDSVIVRRVPAASLSLPELAQRKPTTLAPYVNRSETLQKLVQLGVDLSQVQQFEGMASLLVRSKFDRDIAPYIKFLHQVRVPTEKLGHILTVNPHVLTESLDDLEIRVGYLIHKRFTLTQVGIMLGRAPVIMLMSPELMEDKLVFLKKTFDLTDSEVRQVIINLPRLLPYKKEKIALTRFEVKSFLGFEDSELKQIILKEPSVFMGNTKLMGENFDYLHNTMLIPHSQMLTFPGVLLHRHHVVKNRHLFLLSRHRAQYDPCKENYVSLKALVAGSDAEFCQNIAKTDLKTYYDFLKTL